MTERDRRRTDHWSISRQINLPDILTIAVMLVSVAGAYFKLDGRISALEKDQTTTAQQLSEIRGLLERLNNKLDSAILREIERSKQ